MKLHEFTDRLYAMGGIEQEEKKNRRLTEDLNDIISVTVDFNSDEDDYEVINYIKQKYNIDVVDYDPTDYIENATLRGTKSNIIKYLSTEYQGYDSEEEGIDWVKEFYPELFDESLTEARNPENDEVNAIIRKHLGKKSKISKKEQEVLDRYGISRDEYGEFIGPNGKRLMAYGRKSFGGPEAPVKKGFYGGRGNTHFDWSADSTRYDGSEESFDAVDYANYLTKEQPGEGGHPATNDALYNKSRYPGRDVYTPSDSENKSLRPYSDRYKTLKGNVENAEYRLESSKGSGWRKPMTDEEIEAEVDALRQRLKADQKRYSEWASEDQRAYDDAQKELDDFRKSVSRRRNESLNLNESKQGLVAYFYELMENTGYDFSEQVDLLLDYINDSDLSDLIADYEEHFE